jgi:enoyl-CoA hydratase
MSDIVRYERCGRVAAITMDDGKANVLSVAMLDALNMALDRAEADAAAVVLAGREGVFSGGFDLNVFKAGGAPQFAMLKAGARLARRVAGFPAPVVVACTGHAVAMGVFLLLAGDVRMGVAGAPTKICVNEVAIGMAVPRFAIALCRAQLVPAAVGRAVLTADVFTPDQGAAAGFLDAVVPAADLHDAARAKAAALAEFTRDGYVATKRRARAALVAELDAAMEADISDWRQSLGT